VIERGGREIVRTRSGIAVATWAPGRPSAAFVLQANDPRPPIPPTQYAVYRLQSIRQRQPIGRSATDLTPLSRTGHFVFTIPPGQSRVVIYAARSRSLAPTLWESSARDWPAFDVKIFEGPHPGDGALSQALREDALPLEPRLLEARLVFRIAIASNWTGAAGVPLGLGGVPDSVYGRVVSGEPVLAYGLDLATHLARVDQRTVSLHMARDHHEQLVGAGWSSVQADGAGPYRETMAPEAELQLPIDARGPLRVGVQLVLLPGAGTPASVGLIFDGRSIAQVPVTSEWRRYWWDIPMDSVRRDVHALVLTVPEGQRVAVSDVLIETVD
jgi:hypothetical protein